MMFKWHLRDRRPARAKLALFAAAFTALAAPAFAGDVTGQIWITKRLSKKTVTPSIYSLRGTTLPVSSAEVAAPLREYDRTVVMLEGGKLPPGPAQTIVIEQKNGRFEPDFVVIPEGSTVQFPNSDPIFHNVFSLSRAQPFDLGYYPQSQSRTVKFRRSGIVQVYCHIHASMYAAIVVTSTPWYAKPAEDGTFSWEGVPAGHYRLVAWHKIAGAYSAEVDVPETGKTSVTLRVPVDVEQRH